MGDSYTCMLERLIHNCDSSPSTLLVDGDLGRNRIVEGDSSMGTHFWQDGGQRMHGEELTNLFAATGPSFLCDVRPGQNRLPTIFVATSAGTFAFLD
jgi:hypothetical protein